MMQLRCMTSYAGRHSSRLEGSRCQILIPSTLPCSYDVPLVADIHFQPTVAMMVAEAFEKIRINPGNFADGRKSFEVINYDDPAQFRAEQEHIREVSCSLLVTCLQFSVTACAGQFTWMHN